MVPAPDLSGTKSGRSRWTCSATTSWMSMDRTYGRSATMTATGDPGFIRSARSLPARAALFSSGRPDSSATCAPSASAARVSSASLVTTMTCATDGQLIACEAVCRSSWYATDRRLSCGRASLLLALLRSLAGITTDTPAPHGRAAWVRGITGGCGMFDLAWSSDSRVLGPPCRREPLLRHAAAPTPDSGGPAEVLAGFNPHQQRWCDCQRGVRRWWCVRGRGGRCRRRCR